MVGSESVFHPVVFLPDEYWVFDFTKGPDPDFKCPLKYQVGRYDEVRPGICLLYTSDAADE